jgi:hypothetical protein
MKRDPYLDKYIRLLEVTAARAQKDLERERRRIDFIEGKCERLELVVMESKSDAGREYVVRSDRAGAPQKPPISKVRSTPDPVEKPTFEAIREKWDAMTPEEQAKAIEKQDLVIEPKGRPA